MGLLNFIFDTINDIVDAVCDFFEDIPIINLPFNAIRGLKNFLIGNDDLYEAPPYNPETATIDETVKYNELLTKKREEFTAVCADLEQQIQDVTGEMLSIFLESIGKIDKQYGLSISVEYVRNEFKEYSKKLKGGISGLVNRRLALSDAECAEILGHEAGDKRSSDIDRFLRKIIRESSKNYMDTFDRITSQTLTLVKDQVTGRIADKEAFARKAKKELDGLNRDLSGSEMKEKKEEFEHKIIILNQALAQMEKCHQIII